MAGDALPSPGKRESRKRRWWPAGLVLLLAAIALGWVWFGKGLLPAGLHSMRQYQVLATMIVVVVATAGLAIWLLFLSGFSRRTRWFTLAGVAVLLLLAVACLRIRGVTGDVIPILTFRWSGEVDGPLEPDTARSTASLEGSAEAVLLPWIDAYDFPQFLGPQRLGTVTGVRLARDWQVRPPRLLWKRPIGPGWSSFAVVGGRAYTQEQRGEDELVVCYDLATGGVRWTASDPARYESVLGGIGPRATPTVAAGRVYTLGATGILNCWNSQDGERIWRRDVVGENGASVPSWGKSCSPLVHEQLVVVSAGGSAGRSLVAYDRESGKSVWAGGEDASGYSSPLMAFLAGSEQILIFNKNSVAGQDPRTGDLLWSYPWSGAQPNVAQPVVVGADGVLVSSGYGVGASLLRVARDDAGQYSATLVWERPTLKAKFANYVAVGDFVYGLDDGIFTCIEVGTGKRRWKGGRYGHGQILLVDGLLLVMTDDGEFVLTEPVPDELRELTRFRALEGRTWAPPALAGPYLLVRSDDEVACYELSVD